MSEKKAIRSKEFVINRAKNYGDLELLIEAVENAEKWVLTDPEARQLVVNALRGKKPRKRDTMRDFEKTRMIAEAHYYLRTGQATSLYSKGNTSKDSACDMVHKRRGESGEYTLAADTISKAIDNATEDQIRWAIEYHAIEWPHDIPDDEIRFITTSPWV